MNCKVRAETVLYLLWLRVQMNSITADKPTSQKPVQIRLSKQAMLWLMCKINKLCNILNYNCDPVLDEFSVTERSFVLQHAQRNVPPCCRGSLIF